MSKTLCGALLALCVSIAPAVVTAGTLTFDALPPDGSLVPPGYGGLDWSNMAVLGGSDFGAGYVNAVVSSPNVAFNSYGLEASFSSSSGEFTLTSFYLGAAWNDGLSVLVTASLGGVQAYQTTLTVYTSGSVLETLNWTNIDTVDFISSGGTPNPDYDSGHGPQFAMDNLVINGAGATPELSTWAMMLAGFGGLGVAGYGRLRKQAIG